MLVDRRTSTLGRALHLAFEWSLAGKAVFAALELTGGLLIYFVSTATIQEFVRRMTLNEVSGSPGHGISGHLLAFADHLSLDAKTFFALYLAAHGLVKLVLLVCLALRRRWAYPATMIVLLGFVGYQIYRYTFTHATGLIALSAFDLVLVALTWREYRLMPRRAPA